MKIYEKLGVKRVINCVSTTSPLGSSVVHPEVMDIMKEASHQFVCLDELQSKVGKVIAEYTESEAAVVTSGCDAAITMATAACMMKGTPLEKFTLSLDRPAKERGEWLNWMQKLPNDTADLKNEIILQKCHLNLYSQAHRVAGAKLVLVGTEDVCKIEEIKNAITEKTAAIAFVGMYAHQGTQLNEVLELSKTNNLPIVMDASYTIPPRINLRRWSSLGVDLVCFSGGKSIRGPSDTGILCGRKDLVNLAAIQMSPHHGIGRGFKVDKTQIIGLLKALEIYVEKDDGEEFSQKEDKAKYIAETLGKMSVIDEVQIITPTRGLMRGWPVVALRLNEGKLGISTKEVVDKLFEGDPGIWTYYDNEVSPGGITLNTQNLLDGDEVIVVNRLKEILDI